MIWMLLGFGTVVVSFSAGFILATIVNETPCERLERRLP